MKIQSNSVVTLKYDLMINHEVDGNVLVEKTTDENPMAFIYGIGNMLPKFEENLADMEVGANFDFILTFEESYGEFDEEAVVTIPIETFRVDGVIDMEMLQVNNFLPLTDGQGNQFEGKVVEVSETTVRVDLNHPLAGYDLHFIGQVLEVREATEEEIDHGHVHGVHGHHHEE